MTKNITKEDKKQLDELNAFISKLDPFKKHLSTSLHGYMNIRPDDTRKLLEAYYGPDWNNKTKPSVLTCASCKLATIKNIAIEYEAAKHTVEQISEKIKAAQIDKSKDKPEDTPDVEKQTV